MGAALRLLDDDRAAAVEQLHAATALYTVEPVVRSLFERVSWPRRGATLLDPSCGDGAFLGVALELLLTTEQRIHAGDLAMRVSGFEVHPGAAGDARRRIAAILSAHGYSEDLAGEIVTNADFLTMPPSGKRYDVVIGNPPYLRSANVPPLLREEYESVLPPWARKDMLHAFLDRCAASLTGVGQLALVTADRWLFTEGCARLREVLGERLTVSHVRRLDAASTFYRPKIRRRGSPPRVHPVQIVLESSGGDALSAAPFYPDRLPDIPGVPLGGIAHVRVAPWLGPEGVFVLQRANAERILGADLVPVIDTDDLLEDGTVTAPTRYALRTSPDVAPSEGVMRHLAQASHKLPARARKRRITWLPPERIDKLDLSAQVLVVPRIAQRLRALIVPAGVLPINHNLTVVSRGPYSLEALRTAIESDASQRWLKSVGHRLEKGYFSVTTAMLRSLPIDVSLLRG
jgi:tRNA1(Val) A37 N6-methylase TrmN6